MKYAKDNLIAEDDYSGLYRSLGYQFTHTHLLKQALTRQNAIEEKSPRAASSNYQRLEFLGDRLVNLAVAAYLVETFPEFDEEELNDTYMDLVTNTGPMVTIGLKIGIKNYLICGKGELVVDKMLADAMEAIIGAIFLDCQKYEIVRKIVYRLWKEAFKQLEVEANSNNKLTGNTNTNVELTEDIVLPSINPSSKPSENDKKTSQWQRGNDFERRVLRWKITTTENDENYKLIAPSRKRKPQLARYDIQDREKYYNTFIPLLYDETQAFIEAKLEQVNLGNAEVFNLQLDKIKVPKKNYNPTILHMFGLIPRQHHEVGSSLIALVLMCTFRDQSYSFFALANNLQDSQSNNLSQFKIKIIDEVIGNLNADDDFSSEAKWSAYVLDSIASQQRMYTACIKLKEEPNEWLDKVLVTGNLDYGKYADSEHIIDSETTATLAKLNPKQREAVETFLMLEHGVELLEGPPGTGKTTTIVTALKALYDKKQRVLVCAPSNKAIDILAERFTQRYGMDKVVFIGVKDKLPPSLFDIYVHAWLEFNKNIVKNRKKLINALKDKAEANPGNIIYLIKDTKRNLAELINYIPDMDESKSKLEAVIREFFDICRSLHHDQITTEIEGCINHLVSEMTRFTREAKTLGSKWEKDILDEAYIVFCTCVTAGRSIMHETQPFDVVIVDESGQSQEVETFIPLALNPKKCWLVGDNKQLPPTIFSQLAIENNFQRSLLCRLIEDCNQPYIMLNEQYRMHSSILEWPSKQFYDNELISADYISKRPKFKLSKKNMLNYAFFNIVGREKQEHHSFINIKEAECISQLVENLVNVHKIDAEKQIGIITFYKAQADLITKKLNRFKLVAHTVDSFQGEENDIIIISFVRAANRSNSIGFLKDFRRINVAITRARFHLFAFGDIYTLAYKTSDVQELVVNADERQLIFSQAQFERMLNGEDILTGNRKRLKKIEDSFPVLYSQLKYSFKNENLLKKALTRQSAIEENLSNAASESYQRLEFLGDRVLNSTISYLLYQKYPNYDEDQLHTAVKDQINNKKMLPAIGKKLKLGAYIVRGSGERNMTDKMYADAIEALLGAIYKDNGGNFSVILNVVKHLWSKIGALNCLINQAPIAQEKKRKNMENYSGIDNALSKRQRKAENISTGKTTVPSKVSGFSKNIKPKVSYSKNQLMFRNNKRQHSEEASQRAFKK